jgi:hypothetical protein
MIYYISPILTHDPKINRGAKFKFLNRQQQHFLSLKERAEPKHSDLSGTLT